ncbi:hypothetical protein AM202_0029 [Actinobacillus minor 202]|uniref:tRNA(Met) cytidine acetyltransferase TmcA n=2 Tax=Actinobacillus TaxID=713 RepID=A0ABN3YT14_9PAST|nr:MULTISPECIES: GNAT family N-acetyltransferase [Actinobacillus]ACE87880.1 hypothetical protein AM202_0029 [Actinobacillus minor 202]
MRKLVVLTSAPDFLEGAENFSHIILPILSSDKEKNVTLPRNHKISDWQKIPFSNAKTLLGTEHPFAFFDMRASNGVNFHLEAFAIVAGTIQDNGILYLICPHWHNLSEQMDEDALRWNDNKLITTPHFYHYFKQCIHEFHFEVTSEFSYPTSGQNLVEFRQFTPQQQNIFENLPLDHADIHLITAPRGRGKSTLAGKLAEQIAQKMPVIITSRSQAALPSFWRMIQSEHIQFFPPDLLIKQIEEQALNPQSWLFIDEAASLPLPLLVKFCEFFHKVVLTTTTHNYEGTGRGFSLKLPPLLTRSIKQWQLTQPLRWQENDPLEYFVERLLLLDDEVHYDHQKKATKTDFYRLLAAAHYKTTPTDLRRLFDGENQILFPYSGNGQLLGGIWAINEGGLDNVLSQAIWRGERRPQGSLVAQYLCYQGNLPEAPQLYSVRISRIAVEPLFQKQGIGKRLVSDFILQISQQKQPLVDFISVSFGQTEALTHFWQQCGFELVQITPNKEASSGYYSAMMLYPLTEKGKQFVEKAKMRFSRNQALLPHIQNGSQKMAEDLKLDKADWQDLYGFAYAQRSFQASYTSLKRLYWQYPAQFSAMKGIFEREEPLPNNKKQWINHYRTLVQKILQENDG